jgi:hypothetical protein
VFRGPGRCDSVPMTTLNRIRRTLSSLAAETRPEFKRIDASRALYDDGAWLKDN